MKIIIICFSLVFIFSCQSKKQVPAILQNYNSFEEFLYKESFGSNSEEHELAIKFKPDKNFEIFYGSEGWYWNALGKFSVLETEVELSPIECKIWTEEGKDCAKMFKKAKCILKEINQVDISSKYELFCELDQKFFLYNSFDEDNKISFYLKNSK